MKNLFTSESVTEGHPDKVCDQISDAVLDAYLKVDPNCHVACEVCATTQFVLVMGETSSSAAIDIEKIVRNTIIEIGYDDDIYGFNGHTCQVLIKMNKQSSDIAMGVNIGAKDENSEHEEIGAGDQGIMFGFAVDETSELMPLPITLAHKLAKQLTKVRKENVLHYLRPDGKTQVSVLYEDNVPVMVETILISAQHDEGVSLETLKKDLIEKVINQIIPAYLITKDTKILINPTGRFVIGGPNGDSGLTGRKIIVDTYGGYARHGGGAFSGKDATKVDRSAAYMARYIAKNLVAADVASKLEIQLSYAIGVAKPVSILVETFNTSQFTNQVIVDCINELFDLTPKSIIETLDLLKPHYQKLAAYGHIGREDLHVKWEEVNKVEAIKEYMKKRII